MAATVTVRAKAFGDSRIVFLSKLLGCTWNEAFIRMIRLWSTCAEQQTDKPEVRHIRACLEDIQGDKHLVESGLGDLIADPSLVVVRVRGCDETDWYYAKLELEGQTRAGLARAATAVRDARGRFGDGIAPASIQPSDLCPDLRSGSDPVRPELPDPRTITSAERREVASPADAHLARAAHKTTDDKRRKLINDAWNYAALKHHELKAEGVDPHARNCWSSLNIGEEMKSLRSIVEDLTQGDAPNFIAAQDHIRNRINVAAAEARRDKTLRWFTPMRMWDAKSFARCAALSPEQAATPRRPEPPAPAAPAVRKIKTLG